MKKAFSILADKIEKQDPLKKREKTKKIVEALLFGASTPIAAEKIKEIIEEKFPVSLQEIKGALSTLREEYDKEGRSFEIVSIASGFILRTKAEFAPFIERLRGRREERLSRASSEILAIVAHLQPVTRATIDKIRGVDSSNSLTNLLERGMIEVVGRLENPGRPAQYGITRRFLLHLGLNDVAELSSPEKKTG